MTDHSKEMMLAMLLSKGDVENTHRILSKLSAQQLDEVLDSHLAGGVEDTKPREMLDKALGHLGLIELGIQMGVVAKPDKRVLEFIEMPAVSRYAFRFYPQLLPMLLRDRMLGRSAIEPDSAVADLDLFSRVLSLDSRLESKSIEYFLDIVDDYGDDDDPDIEDIIKALRHPKKLLGFLGLQGQPKKELDIACVGFFQFLEWANYLNFVISEVKSPLVASAIWHHFGYWMGLIGGQLYGALSVSLEGVRTTIQHESKIVDAYDFTELDRQLESLRQLTSSLYAAPLEQWRKNHHDSLMFQDHKMR